MCSKHKVYVILFNTSYSHDDGGSTKHGYCDFSQLDIHRYTCSATAVGAKNRIDHIYNQLDPSSLCNEDLTKKKIQH